MKALRWHGRGDIRLDDVPVPTPTPTELLVAVTWCGICGSDLKEWQAGPVVIADGPHHATHATPPITMGHEFIGVVADVGSAVTGWAPGDRVALEGELRCGVCWQCRRGNYHLCAMAAYLGFNTDGGLAEYVTVDSAQAVRIPDGVDDKAAALLEPLSVAVHAVRRGAPDIGDSVAVLGAGAVGLGVTAVARAHGAGLITVVDPLTRRTDLAGEFGADRTFADAATAGEHDADAELRAAGGYDVVVECSGHPTALASAVALTRRGGVVVTVGLHSKPVTFDLNELTMNERDIRGSLGYQRDFPRALALLAAGKIPTTSMVTRCTDLDHVIDDGFTALLEHGADHIKIIVGP